MLSGLTEPTDWFLYFLVPSKLHPFHPSALKSSFFFFFGDVPSCTKQREELYLLFMLMLFLRSGVFFNCSYLFLFFYTLLSTDVLYGCGEAWERHWCITNNVTCLHSSNRQDTHFLDCAPIVLSICNTLSIKQISYKNLSHLVSFLSPLRCCTPSCMHPKECLAHQNQLLQRALQDPLSLPSPGVCQYWSESWGFQPTRLLLGKE